MAKYVLHRKRDDYTVGVDSLADFRKAGLSPDGDGKSFEEAGFRVRDVYDEKERVYRPYEEPERREERRAEPAKAEEKK